MIRKKKNRLILLALLISCNVFSQQFRNSADLGTVERDSFYSIPVTPEWSSYLKTDLSDVRIADEKGVWIPHIIRHASSKTNTSYPRLQIMRLTHSKETTSIVLENTAKKNMTDLSIRITNTVSIRKAIISGSDNLTDWFTITDSVLLKPVSSNDTSSTLLVQFPPVNYKFIKLNIFNKGNDPFNVIEVWYELWATEKFDRLTSNPNFSFTQKDTMGCSIIKVSNPNRIHFSKFSFTIAYPKYYDRRAKFFGQQSGKPLPDFLQANPTEEFIFSSGNIIEYGTPALNDSVFYLLIENKDSPPLKFTAIETKQQYNEIVSYLEKGKRYKLLFNDPSAHAPRYDLQKFQNNIPAILQELKTGRIEPVAQPKFAKNKTDNKQWLWPVIIIILLLLGYFTWTLIKDLKKRNNK